MEERRGESSDEWMKKAGDSHFLNDADVRAVGQAKLLELGIDPNLPDVEKKRRIADIFHSELKRL